MTALEEFRRDMSLIEYRGEYVLQFHSRELRDHVSSSSREWLVGLAEAYGQMRRDQAAKAAAQ
jgi:hypothetical protein